MKINCPYCSSQLETPEELPLGSKVSCTACGKSFVYPPAYSDGEIQTGREEETSGRKTTQRERRRSRRPSQETKENGQLGFINIMVGILKLLSLLFLLLALASLFLNDRSTPVLEYIQILTFSQLLASAFILFLTSCFLRVLHIIAIRLGRLNEDDD